MNIINKQLYKSLKEWKRENTLLNGMLKDNEKEYRKNEKAFKERYEILNQDLYEVHKTIFKVIEILEQNNVKVYECALETNGNHKDIKQDLIDILRGNNDK